VGPSAPARLDAAVLRIGAVVMLGTLMSILDVSVVSVALPSIQESFGTRPGEAVPHAYASRTVTAYALALAAVIPVAGWAGDRFGTRRLYLAALIVFTLGSALCAMTVSMPSLIATRVLQGIGGGILLPLGMTILARAAGPERMGRLAALLGLPVLLGPIAGPLLGGWLVGTAGWRWIFVVNLPVGLVACWAAVRTLPATRATERAPLDRRGLLLDWPWSCSVSRPSPTPARSPHRSPPWR
jgi:EmrB/QacA subfamily drug resistance transporter